MAPPGAALPGRPAERPEKMRVAVDLPVGVPLGHSYGPTSGSPLGHPFELTPGRLFGRLFGRPMDRLRAFSTPEADRPNGLVYVSATKVAPLPLDTTTIHPHTTIPRQGTARKTSPSSAAFRCVRRQHSRHAPKERCAIPAAHPALVVQNLYRAYFSGLWSSDALFSQLIIKALALAYWDRDVPSWIPSIFPISTCV